MAQRRHRGQKVRQAVESEILVHHSCRATEGGGWGGMGGGGVGWGGVGWKLAPIFLLKLQKIHPPPPHPRVGGCVGLLEEEGLLLLEEEDLLVEEENLLLLEEEDLLLLEEEDLLLLEEEEDLLHSRRRRCALRSWWMLVVSFEFPRRAQPLRVVR